MERQNVWRQLLSLIVPAIVLVILFFILFYVDNKYQTPPPYGKSGIITLSEWDLERRNPIFLIDGWLLTDERVNNKPTYIGEFSNLQRGDMEALPHGKAYYQLTLRYEGASRIMAVDFPQLYSQYVIYMDGRQMLQGTGSGQLTFFMTPGDHVLTVETWSKWGYYSGMYFPPALGTPKTLSQVDSVQNFVYTLAFLLPLALAVFTLFLWRTGGSLSRWFALLCCCYAVYMFRYFVFLFSMPVVQYWFFVQTLALYCLCFCVVRLTAQASGAAWGWLWKWIRAALLLIPAVLLTLCLLIPVWSWAVSIHGRLTDFYYIFIFCSAVFYAVGGARAQNWESRYTLAGCSVFGLGLFVNLFFANHFEPIRFFWQFEWCGLLLALLFSAMMISRNRRILQENDALTNHLEEQVKKRTEEVTQLLDERKAFFSDMAHDLKAPVFATQSFINAIRKSSVGVDMELQGYLNQAEAKQWEMARRLQGLSAINALDKIEEEQVQVSVKEMLTEIYATYHGEAKVQSVHFFVEPPKQDVFLKAQPEKLHILFENLIYNALKATPPNGSITVSAKIIDKKICMKVADSGCGIPKEELPFVFQRFYVGESNRETGTGLGLYIVHGIVRELGGTISVQSTVGEGTEFIMEFSQET